ncbi:hypothetical protein CONCODRAFT_2545 [Conidiobolus coronatus NRRL 28638]|uniref:G-protein coupled receptors family 1 profile domain-containing protein n=1 Tax=Conidiobolus coronatus (strain ATCC 28846 / CBS 209.66 / NRRL 28638) TaxID=796925 RepID=A0A137PH80_CONC2|nr:hypothetical protein CONCODRAFT_2545 [Conidiobolus coronatus NRRL 28638]|eukprot:KXN74340.1 hypothetical protein CONCODRAFT_2545 [Conidiobolus coronatus NRRL 28638]
MNLTTIINVSLNPVGMACSIFVLTSILVMLCINKKTANRMTVRLIAAIALGDLMIHVGEYYSATHGGVERASPLCIRVNAFRLFSRNFYCFTNIAICVHLYRSLVQLKKSTWRYEIFSWIFMLTLTIIFTMIYYFMGAFTGLSHPAGCNPGAATQIMDAIFSSIQAFVNLSTIIACITTTVIGHRSLSKWINNYANSHNFDGKNKSQFIKERRKMAERSFLYPLSTILTLPFETIFLILIACGKFVPQLTIPMAVFSSISGLLTGIAFAIDPAVHSALREAYCNIRGEKNNCQISPNNASESSSTGPLTV